MDRIRERRAALAAQLAEAQARYDQLETTLRELDRQLCAMHGGLMELDALLAEDVTIIEQTNGSAPDRE